MSIYWRCALLLGTTESTVNMICHTISNLFYFYTFFIKCSESNWSSLNVNILALINKKELTFFLDYWVCIATATIVGVFYNVKNGSSFVTSKSSSKNFSNSRELAFLFTFCLETVQHIFFRPKFQILVPFTSFSQWDLPIIVWEIVTFLSWLTVNDIIKIFCFGFELGPGLVIFEIDF